MYLITGVTGMMGGAVLEEARKVKLPLKAMYRNADEGKKAPAGIGTVIADYADKESLRKALENVEAVYLVCSPIPQLVELESNAIDACVEKRVGHVVLNSSLGAEDYPKSFPSWHRKVEDKLKASGLTYTILRPNSFMQNLLAAVAPGVRASGEFYAAMGIAKISLIDVHDIAAVAMKALNDPRAHAGKTYELNGPGAELFRRGGESLACHWAAGKVCQCSRRGATQSNAGPAHAGVASDRAIGFAALLQRNEKGRGSGQRSGESAGSRANSTRRVSRRE